MVGNEGLFFFPTVTWQVKHQTQAQNFLLSLSYEVHFSSIVTPLAYVFMLTTVPVNVMKCVCLILHKPIG